MTDQAGTVLVPKDSVVVTAPPAIPSVERAATVTFTLKSGTLVLTEEEARFVYTALRQWYGRKK